MNLAFSTKAQNYRFEPQDRTTISGTPMRVTSSNEAGHVFSRTDGSGLSVSYSHEQITRLASMGELKHEAGYFMPKSAEKRLLMTSTDMIAGLAANVNTRLSKKTAYVEAFKDLRAQGCLKMTDRSLRKNMGLIRNSAMDFIKNLNPGGADQIDKSADLREAPSARTLRRWIKADEEHGVQGLIDQMSKRGNRACLMGPEALGLLMKHARNYAHIERPTMKTVHADAVIAFEDRNAERVTEGRDPMRVPSYETVRRAIHSMDAYAVHVARFGKEAARKKFRPVLHGLNITRPGQRVEIDEWTVDLITIMRSSGLFDLLTAEELESLGLDKKNARWCLTVAIDVATRCIVGMVLSRNAKGVAAVQCLDMVTRDKGQWADSVGALGHWDMQFTPEHIVTDGGPAFKSEAFRFACADLGVTSERAIAGFPELRAFIERVFRTMGTSLMPRLSGRTMSDIVTKGSADPRKRAALNVEDFVFALLRWTVDIYHNTPHRGLDGETPVECWRRLVAHWGVRPPPDLRRRRACFGKSMVRTLDKNGITILNARYHSKELATFMNRKGDGVMNVRWHHQDVGSIEVCCLGKWIEVPSLDIDLRGTSAQTWLTACRQVKVNNPKKRMHDRSVIQAAIKAIKERNAAAILTAEILVEDWSGERMMQEEDGILSGFRYGEARNPKAADGLAGHSIADSDDTHASMTADTSTKDKGYGITDA